MTERRASVAVKSGSSVPARGLLLQRKCACGTHSPGGGQCVECSRKKRPGLQRVAQQGTVATAPSFTVSPVLTQGGARLPADVRDSLAPLYGNDLTDVRIHHDATSHAAASEVSARAFTLGQHIHFGAGQWRPQDREGRHLIAHELGHALQQRGLSEGGTGTAGIDAADSPLEREADQAADAALAGRSVRIRPGTANGLHAKRLQREAIPGSAGIGSAAGGSEAESIKRQVDPNTTVQIKRTVTERPCSSEPATMNETPSDKIFYWDRDANAIGMHYSVCNGRVKLSSKSEISYDKVVDSAKGLLTTLQGNPALGNNLGSLLENRLDQATIRGSGDITLTVDGILQASIQSNSTVGTAGQKFNVRGVLKITPQGVSFTVTGGVDFSKTPLQSSTTYTLEGKAATEHFAVSLRYEQIDTSRANGPSSSKGQVVGGMDIPLPDVGPLKDVTLGPTITVPTEGGPPVIGGGIKGHFGGPDETPTVHCYRCDCPPPLPTYSCTRDVKAHDRPIEKEPAKNQTTRLLYRYNSTTPADKDAFTGSVGAIAGMVGQGFSVEHIWGYASPEGSLDAPKQPVAGFKGNIELSKRRADDARTKIAKRAPGATLPEAEGKGEQLGDLDGSGDTADNELTSRLAALLTPLSDEKRLDTLGVDDAVRNAPEQRHKALADIRAFVDGSDADGLKLATRPRWEKVFPFLRRVEVLLHKDKVMGKEPVPASSKAGCDESDVSYAKANMSPLPAQRRLPQEQCGK